MITGSIGEAATSTLKAHPQGLPRGELQLLVDRIVKRKVDRQHLSSILQNIDSIYDPECWRRRQIDPRGRFSVTQRDTVYLLLCVGWQHFRVGQSKVGAWVKNVSAPTHWSRLGLMHGIFNLALKDQG